MANDTWTQLNPGTGGDYVDESLITYGGAPTQRKRARVVLAGDAAAAALIDPMNSIPAGTEYALPVRPIPGADYPIRISGITPRAYDPPIAEPGLPVRPIFPREMQDAFGRLRVGEPVTMFESKQIADKQPLFWDDQVVSGTGGASTFNSNQASTTLSCAATTAVQRVRQTFRRFNYQPGKSQGVLLSGILGAPASGITRRIGIFDDSNGLFFESNGTNVAVVQRSNTSGTPADTAVAQSSWNIDKLDGTGPSGITADFSKVQIFGISFEWLGVGSAFFHVVINGRRVFVHQFNTANIGSLVYMSTPNLPLRYELNNDGTGGVASLTHICASVVGSGGTSRFGLVRAINCDATGQTTNNDTNIYPVLAVRLNSGYLGANIQFVGGAIVCTSTAAFMWYLILNPTVTGTAFSFVQIANSALEADQSHTNATTLSGGTILAAGVGQSSVESQAIPFPKSDFQLGSNIAGTSDVVVLAAQRITGTTETFFGGLQFREMD